MHHTSASLNNRHLGIVANEIYEFPASAWYAHVDIAYGIEHSGGSIMGGRQQGYHIRTDSIAFKCLMYQSHFLTIATVGILATLEHTGITALEAQREDIESDVRTSFVYHTYHTKGHADTLQTHAIGQSTLTEHTVKRRRQ